MMMQHTIHVWQKDDESKANTTVVLGAEQFDNVSFESKVKQFLSVLMPCHITRVKTTSGALSRRLLFMSFLQRCCETSHTKTVPFCFQGLVGIIQVYERPSRAIAASPVNMGASMP